jgi:hypothetical protein
MSFDDVLADVKNIYQVTSDRRPFFASCLTEADVQRWSASMGISRAALYDQIAIYLARGFYDLELTFTFCDAIVTDIHGVITGANEERPDLFWSVFLVFDEGEYYHKNNRDEDPVEVYTRPQIAQIIENH